jgi:hypothetical protein
MGVFSLDRRFIELKPVVLRHNLHLSRVTRAPLIAPNYYSLQNPPVRFHKRRFVPDVTGGRWSLGTIDVTSLRVDHSVGIIEETAIGMIGWVLLVQRLQVIHNVVRINSEVSSLRFIAYCVLRPIKKCQRKAGPCSIIRII